MTVGCPHCGKNTSLGEVYPAAVSASSPVTLAPPQLALPLKARTGRTGMVIGAVAGVVVVIAVLGLVAQKSNHRTPAAPGEASLGSNPASASVETISPIIPSPQATAPATAPSVQDAETLHSLLNPATQKVPPGFTERWSWPLTRAFDAARSLKKGNTTGSEEGKSVFALVLPSHITIAGWTGVYDPILRTSLPKYGDMQLSRAALEVRGYKWQLEGYSKPSGKYEAQNGFGAKVTVTKFHYHSETFSNVDTNWYPAYESASSAIGFDWTKEEDLPQRILPVRGPDGKRLSRNGAGSNQKLCSIYTITDAGQKPFRAALLFKLSSPYIKEGTYLTTYKLEGEKATFEDPTEVASKSYVDLFGSVFAVIFFDNITGAIVAKVDLSKTSTEQITLAAEYKLWEENREKTALEKLRLLASETPKNDVFTSLADENIIEARCELAYRYASGESVPINIELARRLLQGLTSLKSQRLGLAQAALTRADAKDREKKLAEADLRVVELQKKDAAAGNARAQFDLGLRHLSGKNVEKNQEEAIKLLRAASAQGYQQATKKLMELGVEIN